jgi:flagellar hook-basal body complex protein FliE
MMASIDAIMGAATTVAVSTNMSLGAVNSVATVAVERSSFADILAAGLQNVDDRVATADSLVRSFALGDPVPLHQVTAALEEARLAVEIAMQVRARLVETYRDFMAMQI